jgi:TonB family protein
MDASTLEVCAIVGDRVMDVCYLDPRAEVAYTIGTAKRARFAIAPGLTPEPEFSIARFREGAFEISWTQAMSGEIVIDGRSAPLCAAPGVLPPDRRGVVTYRLPAGARITLDAGAARFHLKLGTRLMREPVPFWGTLSRSASRYAVGSCAVHVLGLALMLSLPPQPSSLALERFDRTELRPVRLTPEMLPPETRKLSGEGEAGGTGGGAKAAGPEGRAGTPRSNRPSGRMAQKGPAPTRELALRMAERAARENAVISILGRESGTVTGSIFARTDALGSDAEEHFGSLRGNVMGDAWGTNGLGLTKTGVGGGGQSTSGPIGLGRIGTLGKGDGPGGPDYGGRGVASMAPRKPRPLPDVSACCAQVRGALDKEIIRRVIRRRIQEVRFCYEREVQRKPELEGRVEVSFTITGAGAVAAAGVAKSTTGDTAVDSCIVQAVRRLEFPQPEGGGIVVVTYPFLLTRAGR